MSISLHQPSSKGVVFGEQLRLVALLTRTAAALLVGVLLVLAGSTIQVARVARETNLQSGTSQAPNFSFSPQISVLLVGVALLLPLLVWQDEDPTRRLYHWAMPVSRPTHAMLRVLAGWIYLMLLVAVFLVGMVLVRAITQRILALPQPYQAGFVWWEWLVPFTASSIAYILASAAAVATRRPFVWIFGLPLLLASIPGLLYQLYVGPSRDIARALISIGRGRYGAGAALAGQIEVFDLASKVSYPSLTRWAGATAIWLSIGLALLYVVVQRREETSQ